MTQCTMVPFDERELPLARTRFFTTESPTYEPYSMNIASVAWWRLLLKITFGGKRDLVETMLIGNWPAENPAGMLFLDFVAGLFFWPSRSYRRHSFSVYPFYLSFALYGADPSAPAPHQAVHQPSVLPRHAPNSYTNLFAHPNAISLESPCLCK